VAFEELTIKSVAIGGRVHDRLYADDATSACPIFNDKLLTDPFREPPRQYAGDDVKTTAGRERYNQPNGSRRISLRPCEA
jgi:hypothetical protein